MKLTHLLLVTTLVLALTGSLVQAQEPAQESIYDLLEDNPDFSILTTAIETANMESDLTSPDASYTLFAPTNSAFETLLSSMDMTQEDLLADEEMLRDYLSYHIVPNIIATSDIDAELQDQSVFFAETLLDAPVSIASTEGSIFINGNRLTSADTMASNGVIHAVDTVLDPPHSIWETIEMSTNPDEDSGQAAEFTILAQAITIADLEPDLSAEAGNFTIFAPTDAAFQQAAEALNLAPSDLLTDPDFVTSIMLSHVVEGEMTSVDLIGMYVEAGEPFSLDTIQQDTTIEISIDENGLIVGDARILNSDVLTRNGVIHIIDRVLMPEASSDDMAEPEAVDAG